MTYRPLLESSSILHAAGELRARASAEGYLFFRGLIEIPQILRLRRRVLAICLESGWLEPGTPIMDGVARQGARIGPFGDPVWASFQCRALALPEFTETASCPAVTEVLTGLFAGPALAHRGDCCRVFAPHGADLATPPHQDQYYVRGSDSLWTVWIPVGDCPGELGGLAVLPGSHRNGLLEHDVEGPESRGATVHEDSVWHTEDYLCGDVVMFHCLTLHRALENNSRDRLRLSVDYRYQPARTAEPRLRDD